MRRCGEKGALGEGSRPLVSGEGWIGIPLAPVKNRTAAKNRAKIRTLALLKRQNVQRLDQMERQIAAIDAAILAFIEADAERPAAPSSAADGPASARPSTCQPPSHRVRAALKEAGITFKIFDEHVETTNGHVSISTMHLAKGLEFRAVVVMACDNEIIPLQERIPTVGDNADLQEIYDTERHLLYVACTRGTRSMSKIAGLAMGGVHISALR